MLETLKSSSKLRILILIILGLNLIYVIAYTGNMLIEEEYSYNSDLLALLSKLVVALISVSIGYLIYASLSKRVAHNIARVVLNDLGKFEQLAEEKCNKNSSLATKIDEYRKKFRDRMKIMGEYDSVFIMIKFNFFIVLIFSVIFTLSNGTQINIITYTLFQALLLTFLSLIVYLLSESAKKNIAQLIKKLQLLDDKQKSCHTK